MMWQRRNIEHEIWDEVFRGMYEKKKQAHEKWLGKTLFEYEGEYEKMPAVLRVKLEELINRAIDYGKASGIVDGKYVTVRYCEEDDWIKVEEDDIPEDEDLKHEEFWLED